MGTLKETFCDRGSLLTALTTVHHFSPLGFRLGFRLPLGILLLALLSSCRPEPPQIVRPPVLPQDPLIQVFMNQDAALTYTEPYREITRPGANLEQVMIDAIATAQSSLDVAVQELRLPGIANALVERQRAGVQVRVVLENTYSRPYSQFTAAELAKLPARERDRIEDSRRLMDTDGDGQLSPDEINQRDALAILDHAQIPRIDDTADGSAGSNLMHHKFIVIDGKTLIVTSANFTPSDVHGDLKTASSRGNANSLVKISSPELATQFQQEFKLLWGDGPGGQPDSRFGVGKPFRPAVSVPVGTTTVDVQFSPSGRAIAWEQSSNGLISRTLDGAQKSVAMALFVFSDQELVNRLEPVHRRGVEVKLLIEPGFAYRPYSELFDVMGVNFVGDECGTAEVNHPWQPAIASAGVPRMPPGDLLHHKFGIVDQQTTIMGSHNWTAAANTGNDETLLVIHSPTVTAHYQREFERLYQYAVLGLPPAIQKKIKTQPQCPTVPVIPVKATATPPRSPQVKPAIATRPIAQASPTPRSPQTTQPKSAPEARVNLNTATQAELEQLPGVGPKLAQRIMAARQTKPFRSLADLDQVSGVGPKLLQRLQDHVTW